MEIPDTSFTQGMNSSQAINILWTKPLRNKLSLRGCLHLQHATFSKANLGSMVAQYVINFVTCFLNGANLPMNERAAHWWFQISCYLDQRKESISFLTTDPNSEPAMQFSTKQFMCLNEAYALILLANKCSLLNTYNVLGITPCSWHSISLLLLHLSRVKFSSSWSASAYIIVDPHNNPVRKESSDEDVVVAVVQLPSHVWLCDPTGCSMPGFPVPHHLPESAQVHVHWVSDAIQPWGHRSSEKGSSWP